MVEPTFENFIRTVGDEPQVVFCSGSLHLHPQPRFYKHYWQIFTPDCGWEGKAFFDFAPRLCTAEFLLAIEDIRALGRSCLVYGYMLPREGAGTPFDRGHPKWQGRMFATSWDNDSDPITAGGHK